MLQLLTLLTHGPDNRGVQESASHVFAAWAFVLGDWFGMQNTPRKYHGFTAVVCRFI